MPPKSLIPADSMPAPKFGAMQNTISVAITLLGLILALVGAWLTWGGRSVVAVAGGTLFVFGLAFDRLGLCGGSSIDRNMDRRRRL
jgi:hypothetical protein